MSVSILFHAEEESKFSTSTVNPHLVTLTVDNGGHSIDLFLSPEAARTVAALLIADAERCEVFQLQQPLGLDVAPSNERAAA
jgi:hypothetical protein